jgi:hypothetical protein
MRAAFPRRKRIGLPVLFRNSNVVNNEGSRALPGALTLKNAPNGEKHAKLVKIGQHRISSRSAGDTMLRASVGLPS